MGIMIGKTFGKLKVLEFTKSKHSHKYYSCRCDCDKITEVSGPNLRSGNTSGCGSCNKKKVFSFTDEEILKKIKDSGITKIAKELGCSRSVLYRIKKEKEC
jgi:hypothetical protein